MDKPAILCHSCAAREDLWEPYKYFMKKHCEFIDDVKVYMSTEDGNAANNESLFIDIPTGEGEWSDRLKKALDKIDEKRVFFMCEDYWLTETWASDLWDKMCKLHWGENNNTHAVRWRRLTGYHTFYSGTQQLHHRSKYLTGMEATMWRKDFLSSCLAPGETVWQMEVIGTKRLWKRNMRPVIFHEIWDGYENAYHTECPKKKNGWCRSGKLSNKAREMLREACAI